MLSGCVQSQKINKLKVWHSIKWRRKTDAAEGMKNLNKIDLWGIIQRQLLKLQLNLRKWKKPKNWCYPIDNWHAFTVSKVCCLKQQEIKLLVNLTKTMGCATTFPAPLSNATKSHIAHIAVAGCSIHTYFRYLFLWYLKHCSNPSWIFEYSMSVCFFPEWKRNTMLARCRWLLFYVDTWTAFYYSFSFLLVLFWYYYAFT